MAIGKVLAFGHSHLGPLAGAYSEARHEKDLEYELLTYQFLRKDRPHIVNIDGAWRYHPSIKQEILEMIDVVKPDVVAILLQGEQAISAGLTTPIKYYDFFFPAEEGYVPDPASEIIPFNLILDTTARRLEHLAYFVKEMVGHLPQLAFAICPPPPIDDVGFILDADLKHGGISESIEKFGLPPSGWRRRIWGLYVAALRSIYVRHGIGFLDPPAEACDASGFLLQRFRGDVFHANVAYGRLVLAQIGSASTISEGKVLPHV